LKRPLAMALALVALLPLAGLGWMGARLAASEQQRFQQRVQALLETRLNDTKGRIQEFLQAHERQFQRQIQDLGALDAPTLRDLARNDALIRQVFVLDPQGRVLQPPLDGPLTAAETDFLSRARDILAGKDLLYQGMREGASSDSQARDDSGWFTWYGGRGLNIIYWQRNASGQTIGLEVDRVRLLAEVIGILPDTSGEAADASQGRIRLQDERGTTLYQWGPYEPEEGQAPAAALALPQPFSSWKIACLVPASALQAGPSLRIQLAAGLVAAGCALIALVIYLAREYSREMREAGQRLSFVNQVSHELKTPLTNIRMYAELLEDSLQDEGEEQRRKLGVIVSESRRLSRLIENVLAFSKDRQKRLTLRRRQACADDVIRSAIEQFRPGMEAKGIEIQFDGEAALPFEFDPDSLEQILGNLFSNVEKYAGAGKLLRVDSRQQDGWTTIRVSDRGPGIPRGQTEKVFSPFHRLSDRLTEGVAGTGIGLTIARSLARLHGGDLTLLPAEQGASFELRLPIPRTEDSAAP